MENSVIPRFDDAVSWDDRLRKMDRVRLAIFLARLELGLIMDELWHERSFFPKYCPYFSVSYFMKWRSDGSSKLRKPVCDLIRPDRESDLFKKSGKKQLGNGGSADPHDPTIQAGAYKYDAVSSGGINSQSKYKTSWLKVLLGRKPIGSADNHDLHGFMADGCAMNWKKQLHNGGSADTHDTQGIGSMSKVPYHVLEKAAKSDLLEQLIRRRDEDGGPDPKMRRKMEEVSDKKRSVDPNLVMAFCLAAAIGLLLIPKKTRSGSPLQYDLLSVAVALNFSIVIVTIETSTRFPAASQALNVVGTLLATMTAIAMALCFPLSIELCCVLLFLIFILSMPGSVSA